MPELALSTGSEAKLNSIEEKLSELEDVQLLTKLDIISIKERIEKLGPATASPELDEKIKVLQSLANSEKLQGVENAMAKIESLEEKIESLGAQKPAAPADIGNLLDSKIEEKLSDVKSKLQNLGDFKNVDFSELEKKISLVEKADISSRRDELKTRMEGVEKKIDDVRAVPAPNADAVKGEFYGELQKFKSEVWERVDKMSKDAEATKASQGASVDAEKFDAECRNIANMRVSIIDELDKKAEDVKKSIESDIPYQVEVAEKETKSRLDMLQRDVSDLMILKKDIDALRQAIESAKSQNIDQIGQRISALESKQEWAESELLKKDLTAITERLNELERRIRGMAVSMPIFIE